MRSLLAMLIPFLVTSSASANDPPTAFLRRHCHDCHSGDSPEGGINLAAGPLDWSNPETGRFWERVLSAVAEKRMPPTEVEPPSAKERSAATERIESLLTSNVPVGGTVLRRLNRVEYENTIRDLFGIAYSTPASFPADAETDGFDNVGEGLVLSPPLMEQYVLAATEIADQIVPPRTGDVRVEPRTVAIGPADLSVNFEGSKVHGEGESRTLRLVTRNEVLVRSSTWPTRFDARHSGRYRLRVVASAFRPDQREALELKVLARKATANGFSSVRGLRELGVLEVDPVKGRQEFALDVELRKGETPAFYWVNAPFGWDRDGKDEAAKQLHARLSDRRVHAAWLEMGFDRGRTPTAGWKQMKSLMAGENLDLDDPRLDDPPTRFPATVQNQLMWLFENMHHERGPALDLHAVEVTGPTELIEDEEALRRKRRTREFLGDRAGRSDREYAAAILEPFLSKAFRRPVEAGQLNRYVEAALAHRSDGRRFEDGIHVAIRAALCSPEFLYHGSRDGELDDYDLASRLSYFLWSAPPDAALTKLAASGRLSQPDVLAAQTRRLLASRRSRAFLKGFTGQWLDLRLLPEIMPDPRLVKWSEKDRQAIAAETLQFVDEILRDNLPVKTFIDPDFTHLNARSARLYGISGVKGDEVRRVSVDRGGRVGGILGQASVMMATANGVDTQPVLRGVWLLENVFGEAPPPPPESVPAIEPDTAGATSIRELLERHRADASCARCHQRIDPLGFALENFDPVGRWRTHYPVHEKKPDGRLVTRAGRAVDATGVLPDGTTIEDVTDLKRYLLAHVDRFERCLSEKLLVYATGRRLNHADRAVVRRLVAERASRNEGFRDLIVAIVQSPSFRTK